MFLRSTLRKKNGKEHEYFSIVENRRVGSGRVVQRHVLYLGEINSHQQEAWRKTIEIFEEGEVRPKTVALFPEDRAVEISSEEIVRIRLKDMQLRRPRRWRICWEPILGWPKVTSFTSVWICCCHTCGLCSIIWLGAGKTCSTQ